MSENTNKKGSKRVALKGFFRKTFGRDSPIDASPAPSTNASTRNSSQVELIGSSTDTGTIPSTGASSGQIVAGQVDATPVTYAAVVNPRAIPTARDLATPGAATSVLGFGGWTAGGKIEGGSGVHGASPITPTATADGPTAPHSARSQPSLLISNADPVVRNITAAGNTVFSPSVATAHVKSDPGRASAALPQVAIPHTLKGPSTSNDTNSLKAHTGEGGAVVQAMTVEAMNSLTMDAGQGGSKPPRGQYHTFSGSSVPEVSPSFGNRFKDTISVTLEGVLTVAQGLYECSDVFLPLKTAAGIFLTIHKNAERVIGNRVALGELELRLKAILGIVQEYISHGASEQLKFRIEFFCSAIDQHVKEIRHLSDHSLARRLAEGSKDAESIAKVVNSLNVLCDIFQMDTQLHFGTTIVQKLDSAILERLYQRGTAYTARNSSYGDVGGCMPGTRVSILDDLTTWAFDPIKAKIYWLVGMAGTGKSTIAHSFCEILEGYNMLGASFFCSKASALASDAGCIIPGVAYQLANSSPAIKTRVVEAIEKTHELVEPTYWSMTKQFSELISDPIRKCIKSNSGLYKVVVIDALDECFDQEKAANLVRTILSLIHIIPLKILMVSREESEISLAFKSTPNSLDTFFLHNVEKDIVRDDIRLYLQTAFNRIHKKYNPESKNDWPFPSDLSMVLDQCGVLFIYAATLVRYIQTGKRNYLQRFTAILSSTSKSASHIQTKPIDDLYTQVLEQACSGKEKAEVATIRNVLSAIVFLSVPLSASGLGELLDVEVEIVLDSLRTVIFVPSDNPSPITIFHASFPDFVTNTNRCMSYMFPALVEETVQAMLALQCLNLMNKSLKYNICGVSEESIWSKTNPKNQGQISEALAYACTHWATHFSKLSEINDSISRALSEFLEAHLLHWFECLSIIQKLENSIDMLRITENCYMKSTVDIIHNNSVSLIRDAKYLIQLCFSGVKEHCFEVYNSMPAWLPKHAYMRKKYTMPKVPQVMIGFFDYQSEVELDIKAETAVTGVAFSPDEKLITGGLENGKVMVWNARTGQAQAQLQSHTGQVYSTAYSPNGKYLASASADHKVKIWNAITGELWADLQKHKARVNSVVFSPDNKFVASASHDKTVIIWEVGNEGVCTVLTSHTAFVKSIAYSPNGQSIASGSGDETIKIWDVTTGQLKKTLQGHTDGVYSVTYSPDGKFIASGSSDTTIRIWDINTNQTLFKLHGHTNTIWSLAYSPDGKCIVSGSRDHTLRIWDSGTGTEQTKLIGHTYAVYSSSYSPSGQYIVSAGGDYTIKLWPASAKGVQTKLEGHGGGVWSVAYSPDGRYIASASSDKTVRTWDTSTGQVEAELQGHTDIVNSVTYSPNGSYIVSGSSDKSIIIWDTGDKKVQNVLKGHTNKVLCVVFSPDGRLIASASSDRTVRTWDAKTGQMQARLQGHESNVRSVAFSPDARFIVSVSNDGAIKVWDLNTGLIHIDLEGHTNEAVSVAYSPDGRFIASASTDTTIRIWDSEAGQLLAVLYGHTDTARQIFFSHNARVLLSFSYDQTLRTWDLGNLTNEQQPSIASNILWDFQSGWLTSDGKSYWSPVHSILWVAIHGTRICTSTRAGKVFDIEFGIDPFHCNI